MEALTAWPEKYYRRKTNSSRRMPRRSEVRLRPSSASSEGENENVEVSKQGEESANEKPNHERDLERGAKRKNGSPSIKCEAAEQSVTPIGKTLRLRDRFHPFRPARARYRTILRLVLAGHGCACHSPHDWDRFGEPAGPARPAP